jgi:hypothetical protein
VSGAWNYRRRQGGCAACGREFVTGETLFSLLRFSDDELERGDLDEFFQGRRR